MAGSGGEDTEPTGLLSAVEIPFRTRPLKHRSLSSPGPRVAYKYPGWAGESS